MTKTFYYAFKKEKDGPKIYDSWQEVWSVLSAQVMTKPDVEPLFAYFSVGWSTWIGDKTLQGRIQKVKNGGNVFVTGPAVGWHYLTFLGWDSVLGKRLQSASLVKFRRIDYLRERWQAVESLIIDERGDRTERLDMIRDRLGAFSSLSPETSASCHQFQIVAMKSAAFHRDTTMTLKPRVPPGGSRHKPAFADILNDMRWGKMNKESISKLRQLSRKLVYEDGIEPTELYPRRWEVEKANNTRLEQIAEIPVEFNAVDRPGFDERGNPVPHNEMARLLDRIVALPTVVLKTGAQVMLIKNLVQGHLVNGSVGKVIGFFTGLEAARRGVDLACRETPEDERRNAVKQCPTRWPLVKFTNDLEFLCSPEEFTVDGALGNVEASRTQVPLILAWALSVHKSQGQTLERVKVDLRNTFEKGQGIVMT
ncbi:hypothetical protein EDB89DRAFT_1911107 [Lactarius sanguifluus]|nr:hypothetical protein EDB89DRAFT_1911107 [Lactarius sanguifluus]